MSWIVDPVFIKNQRIREGTYFKEAVPISGVSCQSRHFQSHDYSGSTKSNVCHQTLKSCTINCLGPRQTKIVVYHYYSFCRPSQRNCTVTQTILSFGAFSILKDLPES